MTAEQALLIQAINRRVAWLHAEPVNSQSYHKACTAIADLGRALDAVTNAIESDHR